MRQASYQELARQVRAAQTEQGITQRRLAAAIHGDPTRISKLFSDLENGKARSDRLTLLLEICDILDLVPVLVPATRLHEIRERLDIPASRPGADMPSAFDDLFVELSDEADQ